MKTETKTKNDLAQQELDQVKNEIKEIDTKNISVSYDALFNYCQSALEKVQYIKVLNQANKKLGLKFHINTDILIKAIDYCLMGQGFEENEMDAYFNEVLKLENYLDAFEDIVNWDKFYFPFELEFVLLGIDAKKYFALSEESRGHICDAYGKLRSYFQRNIDTLSLDFASGNATGYCKELLQAYGILLPGFEVEVPE